MKITKQLLKEIIQEEVKGVIAQLSHLKPKLTESKKDLDRIYPNLANLLTTMHAAEVARMKVEVPSDSAHGKNKWMIAQRKKMTARNSKALAEIAEQARRIRSKLGYDGYVRSDPMGPGPGELLLGLADNAAAIISLLEGIAKGIAKE